MKKNNSLDPRGRAEHRIAIFRRKLSKYIEKTSLETEQTAIINALAGHDGRSALLLLSDLEARMKASDCFSRLFQEQSEANPDRRYYFFTFTDESGFVSDRATMVDVENIMKKAGRALRSLKVSAVAVLEVHPLANYPGGGAGRTLLFHVHAIGWMDESFDPKEAELALHSGGAWKNPLGAAPVKIKPIAHDAEDLEEVSRYCLKPPHAAKNRKPSKKDPTRFQLLNTVKGYRPEFAFRTLELLSQIEMLDVVVGIGEGKRLRQDFRKAMTEWHKNRGLGGKLLPGEFDIWHFWFQLRRGTGSKLFLPVRIIGGGYRMRIVKLPRPKQRKRRGLSLPKWKRAGRPGNQVPSRRRKS